MLCVLSHSAASDSATPWTVAHQALLSTEFSRQEYWSGLSFPPPGDPADPGIELTSSALADGFFTHWAIREAQCIIIILVTGDFMHHHLLLGSQSHHPTHDRGGRPQPLWGLTHPRHLKPRRGRAGIRLSPGEGDAATCTHEHTYPLLYCQQRMGPGSPSQPESHHFLQRELCSKEHCANSSTNTHFQ